LVGSGEQTTTLRNAVAATRGSVRDADVIAAANRLGLAMMFTGVRHFRH